MDFSGTAWVQEFVALRKESVDRNEVVEIDKILNLRRSPQGERG